MLMAWTNEKVWYGSIPQQQQQHQQQGDAAVDEGSMVAVLDPKREDLETSNEEKKNQNYGIAGSVVVKRRRYSVVLLILLVVATTTGIVTIIIGGGRPPPRWGSKILVAENNAGSTSGILKSTTADVVDTPHIFDLRSSSKHHQDQEEEKNEEKIEKLLNDLNARMVGTVVFRDDIVDNNKKDETCRVWNKMVGPAFAVVNVATADDVSLAVVTLGHIQETYGKSFRIRSGGHNYAGYSGIENGIILSLSNLQRMDLDETTQIATVGPAVTVELFLKRYLLPFNYFTTVGFCPMVAEGGFIGGGGWGASCREHGLGIDNVVQVQAVLANGTQVIASHQEHADLFWALRGGGHNNFAIITEIQLQLHPTLDLFPLVSGFVPKEELAMVLYDIVNLEVTGVLPRQLFFAVSGTEFDGEGDDDGGSYLFVQMGHLASNEASLHSAEDDLQELTTKLFTKETVQQRLTQETISYTAMATDPSMYYPNVYFQAWFGYLFPEDNSIETWTFILDALLEVSKKFSSNIVIEIGMFGGAIADIESSATAYYYRNAVMNVGINFLVPAATQDDDDDNNNSNAKAFFENGTIEIAKIWSTISPLLTGTYPNYAMPDLSKNNSNQYLRQYWGDNLERLVQLKHIYDPKNVFHHPQSIPTKLD